MLWTVLRHLFSQPVVHVVLDAFSGLFFKPVDRANDLRFYGALSWECLNDRLGLETYGSFGQDRRENTASTVPWLGPLFVLHAKDLKTPDVHLGPVFPAGNISLDHAHDVGADLFQLSIVHVLGQVVVKCNFAHVIFWHEVNLKAVNTNFYTLGVFNFDLDYTRLLCFQTQRGRI